MKSKEELQKEYKEHLDEYFDTLDRIEHHRHSLFIQAQRLQQLSLKGKVIEEQISIVNKKNLLSDYEPDNTHS